MKNRLAELAYQRRAILKEIEAQRVEMADISRRFQKPILILDMGLDTMHFFHRHPTLKSASLAVLLSLLRRTIPGLSYLLPSPLRFVLNNILSASTLQNKNSNDLDSNN